MTKKKRGARKGSPPSKRKPKKLRKTPAPQNKARGFAPENKSLLG